MTDVFPIDTFPDTFTDIVVHAQMESVTTDGKTTFRDLTDPRLTLEIVHDRRHGELLRIKPTPRPTLEPGIDPTVIPPLHLPA